MGVTLLQDRLKTTSSEVHLNGGMLQPDPSQGGMCIPVIEFALRANRSSIQHQQPRLMPEPSPPHVSTI